MRPRSFEWDVVVLAVSSAREAVELEARVRSVADFDRILGTALSRLPRGGDVVVSVVAGRGGKLCPREVGGLMEAAGLRLLRVVDLPHDAVLVAIAATAGRC